MPVREGPPQPPPPHKPSAEEVRGGEIILRTRLQRSVFIAGLAGAVLLGAVLAIAGLWRA